MDYFQNVYSFVKKWIKVNFLNFFAGAGSQNKRTFKGKADEAVKEGISLCLAIRRFLSLSRKNIIFYSNHSPSDVLIFFIHGYLDNGCCWSFHISELEKSGYKGLFTIDLPKPFLNKKLIDCSIDETYSAIVEEAVDKISADTGCRKVILVGHSMGTLVAIDYAVRRASKKRISVLKVIGLAGPVNGTHSAWLGIGKCALQMRRFSDYLQNLHEECAESKLNVSLAGSDSDLLILPRSSAVDNPHGWKIKNFSSLGHLAFCDSIEVNQFIEEEIGSTIRELQ